VIDNPIRTVIDNFIRTVIDNFNRTVIDNIFIGTEIDSLKLQFLIFEFLMRSSQLSCSSNSWCYVTRRTERERCCPYCLVLLLYYYYTDCQLMTWSMSPKGYTSKYVITSRIILVTFSSEKAVKTFQIGIITSRIILVTF
jgi:hypothetical protein